MSAKYEKRDGFMYSQYDLNDYEASMLVMMFEDQIDYDIKMWERELLKVKMLKRQCIIKTLVLPVELPLSYFLLGKSIARERYNTQKLYWKFLTRKMTIEEFENELNLIIANSIVGK